MDKYRSEIKTVIYTVTLITPFQKKSVFNFGSIAAIFEHLPKEVIGIKLNSLYVFGIGKGRIYVNSKCKIEQQIISLYRKKTNRGKKS